MKVIIDGQEREVQESETKSIFELLEEIDLLLKEEKRIIINVEIDGQNLQTLDDPQFKEFSGKNCKTIKVDSAEPKALSISILHESARFMPTLVEKLSEISQKFQTQKEMEALEILHTCLETWMEINQGIKASALTLGFDFGEVQVGEVNMDMIQNEIQKLLDSSGDAMQRKDFMELSDLFEHELSPKLRLLEEGLYIIIKEAEKKPH